MNNPVLIYLTAANLSKNDPITIVWNQFTHKTRENKQITCLSVNCNTYNQLCHSMSGSSMFITIYKEFYQIQNLTDISIQGITNIYKNSYSDPSLYCQNFYFPTDKREKFNYPTFVFKYNESLSCIALSRFKIIFPQANFLIKRDNVIDNSPNYQIEICYSPVYCIENSLYPFPSVFINEYKYDHFGNWTLKMVSHIHRRLVLIVYSKSRPQRSTFERYIQSFSNDFLFGQIPYSDVYGAVYHFKEPENAPFMLITNVKKTRFMIVDYTRLSTRQIIDTLNSARQGLHEFDMNIFFDERYASVGGYYPKNVMKFAVMAFCVITITAFATLWKAKSCIDMFGERKYENQTFL